MTQIISQYISENWLSREEMTAYLCVKTGKSLFFTLILVSIYSGVHQDIPVPARAHCPAVE